MKTIELEDTTAAITMTAEGKLSVYMPTKFAESEDNVPVPIQYMLALSILVGNDEAFFLYVMDKFNKIVEEQELKEEEKKDE